MSSASSFFMHGEKANKEPYRTSVCVKMPMSMFKELLNTSQSKDISLSEEIRERMRNGKENKIGDQDA